MDEIIKQYLTHLTYEQLKKMVSMPIGELANLLDGAIRHKAFMGQIQETVNNLELNAELIRMLKAGLYINAIKFLREQTGYYLKESKQYVDALKIELGL